MNWDPSRENRTAVAPSAGRIATKTAQRQSSTRRSTGAGSQHRHQGMNSAS